MNAQLPEKEKRFCHNCQIPVDTVTREIESGVHHAKEECLLCGRFVCWTKKPKNTAKRPPNKYLPDDLGISNCQMCLRHKDRLGTRGILHSHHIIEINDNGVDLPENIWVLCTACHALVHHQRTYLNNHLQAQYTIKELRSDMDKHRVPKETRDIMERIFTKQGECDA